MLFIPPKGHPNPIIHTHTPSPSLHPPLSLSLSPSLSSLSLSSTHYSKQQFSNPLLPKSRFALYSTQRPSQSYNTHTHTLSLSLPPPLSLSLSLSLSSTHYSKQQFSNPLLQQSRFALYSTQRPSQSYNTHTHTLSLSLPPPLSLSLYLQHTILNNSFPTLYYKSPGLLFIPPKGHPNPIIHTHTPSPSLSPPPPPPLSLSLSLSLSSTHYSKQQFSNPLLQKSRFALYSTQRPSQSYNTHTHTPSPSLSPPLSLSLSLSLYLQHTILNNSFPTLYYKSPGLLFIPPKGHPNPIIHDTPSPSLSPPSLSLSLSLYLQHTILNNSFPTLYYKSPGLLFIPPKGHPNPIIRTHTINTLF